MTAAVLTIMPARIALALLLVAGCSAPPATDPAPRVTVRPHPTSSTEAAPGPTAVPIDRILPPDLDGVELHTFAVGEDIVARLSERLGIGTDDLEVRYASEHGARFFQAFAVRTPGRSGAELVDAWAVAAYPPGLTDVEVAEREVGGRAVTVITSASAQDRLGAFYAHAVGETLLVVQAFDDETAAQVLAALP